MGRRDTGLVSKGKIPALPGRTEPVDIQELFSITWRAGSNSAISFCMDGVQSFDKSSKFVAEMGGRSLSVLFDWRVQAKAGQEKENTLRDEWLSTYDFGATVQKTAEQSRAIS